MAPPTTQPLAALGNPIRRLIVGEVRALFNDQQRGETPVVPKDGGLFGRDAVAWRVHGDVTSMMVGGVSALLLQMLHPGALAGVWDHSDFSKDMIGRLRRTARFIALTTYGDRDEALAVIDRVRAIHDTVHGTLPDGTRYDANDPHLLNWVHVAEGLSFLDAWRRYAEPGMSRADQDRYFAEVAVVAEALGADDPPRDRGGAEAFLARCRAELVADARVETVRRMLLETPAPSLSAAPFQTMTVAAGIDLLPPWARAMHGFPQRPLRGSLVRAGTGGLARTLRWAFGPK